MHWMAVICLQLAEYTYGSPKKKRMHLVWSHQCWFHRDSVLALLDNDAGDADGFIALLFLIFFL